jgi:hypothetical protein
LGLGWSSADEKKMRTSFGFGRADFSRFIDLQAQQLYVQDNTAEICIARAHRLLLIRRCSYVWLQYMFPVLC